ncbi:MAG TPA: SxtJ family membrane protein [Gemmatimonadales bacterium]|nr:SxtJ family membrane protein [Gemmatimonadales bacterium]
MAGSVPARLSAAEGRKFGLTVGIAFLVLATLLSWRGRPYGALGAAVVGGLLLIAGLAIPTRLAPVRTGWMRLAEAISRVTTPVFMAIVYFGVITPTGLLLRLGRHRPLVRQRSTGGVWLTRATGDRRSDLTRQF